RALGMAEPAASSEGPSFVWEGDEDWRHGPTGHPEGAARLRARWDTARRQAASAAQRPRPPKAGGAPGQQLAAAAAATRPPEGLGGPWEGDEDWRHGPTGHPDGAAGLSAARERAAGAAQVASPPGADGAGTQESLVERFRRAHNQHGTPARSLSGSVGPRTVWAYWHQGAASMPELFRLCVETWTRHSPRWRVQILDRSTVFEYLSEVDLPGRFLEIDSPQLAADCVRLALLARYGGVWLDASVILTRDLDELIWSGIDAGQYGSAAFFHRRYGTARFGSRDFVESWCLATRPRDAFFLKWRDLLRELLHNRTDVVGILGHPLYRDLDLGGLERLAAEFPEFHCDLREYLALHAMFRRLLLTDGVSQDHWQRRWLLIDAADGALAVQGLAQEIGCSQAEVLLGSDARAEARLQRQPLLKLPTAAYAPLLQLPRHQLLDEQTQLGRLLRAPGRAPPSGAPPRAAAPAAARAALGPRPAAGAAPAGRRRPRPLRRGGGVLATAARRGAAGRAGGWRCGAPRRFGAAGGPRAAAREAREAPRQRAAGLRPPLAAPLRGLGGAACAPAPALRGARPL
ncbi:unnamed protein product, partial [Prorocentrum cordatum]